MICIKEMANQHNTPCLTTDKVYTILIDKNDKEIVEFTDDLGNTQGIFKAHLCYFFKNKEKEKRGKK